MKDSDPEYEKIAVRYSCSFMSNTKWRRVFVALSDAGVREIRTIWKHIDSEYLTEHILMPLHSDLLDNRFQDGYFQPYEYKWIEWIRFPRKYFDKKHHLTREQDLSQVEVALAKCGSVNIVSDKESVTLLAYKE